MERALTDYFLLFFIPFLVTVGATFFISRFAAHKNIVDQPGEHKIHLQPKPLLGGVGIFFGFSAALLIFLPVDDRLVSLVLGTAVLVATGLLDDLYNLRPLLKLAGQTVAVSIVILWDISLYEVLLDYFARFYLPEGIVLFLIIGWVVLIINAFNLIDGLDGLAAGTAAIIFLAMAVIKLIVGGNPHVFALQMIGLAACLGFLIFNFNPAKIFMGDTGSMLLGFILAITHLYTIKYPFNSALVLGSIFIFAYPALDVTYAFYRRLCRHCPILQADRAHIHHVLLSFGFSVRKTVLIIYAANLVFTLMAVVLLSLELPPRVLLVIGVLTAIGVLFLFRFLYAISERNGVGLMANGPGKRTC